MMNVIFKVKYLAGQLKKRCNSETEIKVVIIDDVALTKIERSKKQKQYYIGQQKCHTLKRQLLIN